MQLKVITLLIVGLTLSTTLWATVESINSSLLYKVKGQEELKTLKEMQNYDEIFDNYHLGGISPDAPPQKGQ